MIKKTLLTISLVGVFTACTHKNVEVHKAEDQILNCKKLTSEIAELIDINNEINENTGLGNRSIFAWVTWPAFGVVNQINASSSRANIDKRHQYLVLLKKEKGCKIFDREIMFLDQKGRVSDNF